MLGKTDSRTVDPGETVHLIKPTGRIALPRIHELWEYRELVFFLTWRDIKVRYKQTILGAVWAILQPLLTAAVFSLFFGRIAGISSDGVPYALFSYTGLLIWTFFAQAITQASAGLVGSAHLLTKVYFPRMAIPLAAILAALVDLAVAFPVLGAFFVYYDIVPGARILFLPIALLLAVTAALGVGLWLAALNVEYRDIRYVIPFLVQLWLFLTPVIYPSSSVLPRLEHLGLPGWLLSLNPMTGVVELARWSALGLSTNPWPQVLVGSLAALVLLGTGAVYFRSVEKAFADVV